MAMASAPAGSVLVARYEPPVLPEVADRMLCLAGRFVEPRQVVMAVGEVGILGDGSVVRLESRFLLPQVLECNTQVEEQQRIGAAALEGAPIHPLRSACLASLVQQASPVDPRRRIAGVRLGGARVRLDGPSRIGALEAHCLGEPVVRTDSCRF